jgi:hypothetical protein
MKRNFCEEGTSVDKKIEAFLSILKVQDSASLRVLLS